MKCDYVTTEKYAEAIRELLPIQEKRDLILAAPLAMIYAHEKCDLVDKEAIDELHARLTIAHTNPSVTERAYVYAALFLSYTGNYDEARKYIKGTLETKPNSPLPMSVMGWIDLECSEKKFKQKSVKIFDAVLERDPKYLLVSTHQSQLMLRHCITLFSLFRLSWGPSHTTEGSMTR
jgi:tetratricopeptide repeat protein 21B